MVDGCVILSKKHLCFSFSFLSGAAPLSGLVTVCWNYKLPGHTKTPALPALWRDEGIPETEEPMQDVP